MRFSERYGHVAPRDAFQSSSLDASTRNRLINIVILQYLPNISPYNLSSRGEYFFRCLIDEFFKSPINAATDRFDHASSMLAKWVKSCDWFRILDLLEFVAEYDDSEGRIGFVRSCNQIFEEEKVGYRFVKKQIVPIVDKIEVATIEQSLNLEDEFEGTRTHIARALELYSERKNPDYRNAIKEAVSAVESAAKVISGKRKATLSDALKEIDKVHGMHPALKDALIKLYGYSSDKQGIRHALIDAENIGHAEAKLMLIGCSTFCNYMIEQYGKR